MSAEVAYIPASEAASSAACRPATPRGAAAANISRQRAADLSPRLLTERPDKTYVFLKIDLSTNELIEPSLEPPDFFRVIDHILCEHQISFALI
jgi:hypothetical protein